MYPALAAGYALCCARAYFRKTLFLLIPSILFTAAHFLFVPTPTDPYYRMHFHSSLETLLSYWGFTIGALRHGPVDWRPLWLGFCAVISISVGLAVFSWKKLRSGDLRPLFLLGWFVLVILPVLPLSNHFTEYYVTVPSIGLALLGAWAIVEARGLAVAVAIPLTALYLTVSIADLHAAEKFNYERSRRVKYLVTGLEALPKAEANKKLLLAGIDNDLFWSGLYGDPFRLDRNQPGLHRPGIGERYRSASGVGRHLAIRHRFHRGRLGGEEPPGDCSPVGRTAFTRCNGIFISLKLVQALNRQEFRFCGCSRSPICQPRWTHLVSARRRIPLDAQNGDRKNRACPTKSGQVLKIKGFCPAAVVAAGPLEVGFRADGVLIGKASLKQAQQFELQFPLPSQLIGESTMELEIDVSRTTRVAGDPRVFGLTFGTFTVE